MQRPQRIIAMFKGYGRILMNQMLNSSQCKKNSVAIIGFLVFMSVFTFPLFQQLKQKFKRN